MTRKEQELNDLGERNKRAISRHVLDAWNDQGYQILESGEGYSLVMLGESHFESKHQEKEVELIYAVKPQFILHEFADGYKYNPKTRLFEKQRGRKFSDLDDPPTISDSAHYGFPIQIIQASEDLQIPIIGCDLTETELTGVMRNVALSNPQDYEFIEVVKYGISMLEKRSDPDYIITPQSEELIPYRDQQMVKTITGYSQLAQGPLVIILGSRHSDDIHNDRYLQQYGFGYAYINLNQ